LAANWSQLEFHVGDAFDFLNRPLHYLRLPSQILKKKEKGGKELKRRRVWFAPWLEDEVRYNRLLALRVILSLFVVRCSLFRLLRWRAQLFRLKSDTCLSYFRLSDTRTMTFEIMVTLSDPKYIYMLRVALMPTM
jgi:hypothetical protein